MFEKSNCGAQGNEQVRDTNTSLFVVFEACI